MVCVRIVSVRSLSSRLGIVSLPVAWGGGGGGGGELCGFVVVVFWFLYGFVVVLLLLFLLTQTQKGSNKHLFLLILLHSMQIFGEIPFIKPRNDT